MNVIKMLKKQIELGKDVMMNDGTTIGKEDIRKAQMKNYLAGVKAGDIPTDKSFEAYAKENSDAYVSVQEVIDFIQNVDQVEAGEEAPAAE